MTAQGQSSEAHERKLHFLSGRGSIGGVRMQTCPEEDVQGFRQSLDDAAGWGKSQVESILIATGIFISALKPRRTRPMPPFPMILKLV